VDMDETTRIWSRCSTRKRVQKDLGKFPLSAWFIYSFVYLKIETVRQRNKQRNNQGGNCAGDNGVGCGPQRRAKISHYRLHKTKNEQEQSKIGQKQRGRERQKNKNMKPKNTTGGDRCSSRSYPNTVTQPASQQSRIRKQRNHTKILRIERAPIEEEEGGK
jgi:hypothetical protein